MRNAAFSPDRPRVNAVAHAAALLRQRQERTRRLAAQGGTREANTVAALVYGHLFHIDLSCGECRSACNLLLTDKRLYRQAVKQAAKAVQKEVSRLYADTGGRLLAIGEDAAGYFDDASDAYRAALASDLQKLRFAVEAECLKCMDSTRAAVFAAAETARIVAGTACAIADATREDCTASYSFALNVYGFSASRLLHLMGRLADSLLLQIRRSAGCDLSDSQQVKLAWDILSRKMRSGKLVLTAVNEASAAYVKTKNENE